MGKIEHETVAGMKDLVVKATLCDLASGVREGIRKKTTQICRVESKKECEHPEKLKGKPEECSPEQIRECHGDVEGHPCVEEE